MIELILATICICLIFLMCWKICDDMLSGMERCPSGLRSQS